MHQVVSDPFKLILDADIQEKVDAALCDLVRNTVIDCSDRDEDLRQLRRQLEGGSQPAANEPWPGACQVESTISRELHTTVVSALWQAARQRPYASYEAAKPDEIDAASRVETYMDIKAQQFNFDKALYDSIYLAAEGRYAPLYQCYEEPVVHSFDLIEEEPGDENTPPTKIVVRKQETQEGCIRYRTPNPWDFYTYPVTAKGPAITDGCLITVERMFLTAEDLALGVMYEAYDKNAVKEMLAKGPATLEDESREDELDRDGVSTANTQASKAAGSWECFQLIGRMPLCPDDEGEPLIPETLEHVDCLWMICPALNIRFKQAYSPAPDGMRPYTIFHVIEKPNSLLGEGICSILTPIHEEMTAIERFGINNMNLEASPVMTVAESWLTRYSKWTIAPGRMMPRQSGDPVGPRPLTWDVRSQQLIMPWLQYLDGQGSRLGASQGANSALSGRVRKAAEVHFAESMQQTKFDLFLSNIQRGVVDAMEKSRALLQAHMGEGSEMAYSEGASVEVDAEIMGGSYRIFAQATSDSLTPAARLSRQQAIDAIVTSYWMGVPQYSQLMALHYWWQLKARLLMLAGERTPERYLGPEPPPPQPMGGMGGGMDVQAIGALLGLSGAGAGGPTPTAGQGAQSFGDNGIDGFGAPQGAETMMGAGMEQASDFSPRPSMNGAY